MNHHIKIQHSFGCHWKCSKCSKTFGDGYALLNHNEFEHALGKYQCSVEGCDFIASYKVQIFSHFLIHYDKFGALKEGVVIRPEAIKPHSEWKRENEGQSNSRSKKLDMRITFENSDYKYTTTKLLCPVKSCDFECIYQGDNYQLEKHNLEVHQVSLYSCSAPNCSESFNFR